MNVAEFVYTQVLRSKLAKRLANRIIFAMLPNTVQIGQATVVLNPADPVVSGALTFGVYEPHEIALMQHICKPGQIMIDVGANVGLYTAIAGIALGSAGRVIALEPDPESFRFLQKTVRANALANTTLVMAAASNKPARCTLFTSSANRGDNRLYQNELADGAVDVEMICLDDYLAEQGVEEVDIVKIDVQGFEGHVIEGLERTIRRSPRVTILMEFWPQGLSSAGTDPEELLNRLERLGLLLCELRPKREIVRIENKAQLIARLSGRRYTNLVLLGPSSAPPPDAS